MARLSVVELLNAFENGADAVVVVACPDNSERYPHATTWMQKRVNQTRDMLSETGLDPNRLKMLEVDSPAVSIRDSLSQAVQEIKKGPPNAK